MRQYRGERKQVCEKARQVVLTVMFTPPPHLRFAKLRVRK